MEWRAGSSRQWKGAGMINKHPVFYLLFLFVGIALVAFLVKPITALAEGETPPLPETEPVVTVEAPVETVIEEVVEPVVEVPVEETVVEETPGEEAVVEETTPVETVVETPVEETVIEETVVEETATEETVVEETTTEESVVHAEAPTGTEENAETRVGVTETSETITVVDTTTWAAAYDPATVVVSSAEQAAATSEETVVEEESAAISQDTITAVINERADVDLSEVALVSAPDPYIIRADGYHRFLYTGGCAAYGGVSAFCQESTNPIQSAINSAFNGETIHVEAGTYTEQLQILNMTLTLQGHGNPTIVAPSTLSATGAGFALVYASNSILNMSGFILNNSAASDGDAGTDNAIFGIYYNNSSGSIYNNTIYSNTSTTDNTYGIYINNDDGTARLVEVTNNVITDYTDGGIYAEGNNLVTDIYGNVITNSGTPADWSAAIRVDNSTGHTISNNTITGNNFQGIDIRFSDGNEITGNYIADASRYGISLVDSDNNMVTLNIIMNTDETSESAGISVDFDSDYNTVSQNWVEGGNIGMVVRNNSDNDTFKYNHVVNNVTGILQEAEIGWDAPINTVVTNNILTGNTVDIQNDTDNNIYAQYNWWGCPEGPPTCGVVVGDVDTSNPLLVNPDPDNDLFFGAMDNCPLVFNPDQIDSDWDGYGDACDNLYSIYDTQIYKIYANWDPEVEMDTYAFELSGIRASAFQLVDLLADTSEVELVQVYYELGIEPEGTEVTFEQLLEEILPKPLNDDAVYLGPAFILGAFNVDGEEMDELSDDMELRWKLPEGYTPPAGYRIAVHYFDNESPYWQTEEWEESNTDFVGDYVYAHDEDMGSYMLVLVPED